MPDSSDLVSITEVATKLFGDTSATSRKRVRNMIATGILRGRKIGTARRSPFWVSRASLEEFLDTL